MIVAKPHGSERLRKAGVAAMWIGFALVVMPALPADHFANVHEILVLWKMHWWLKFAGVAALIVGNIVRLIGTQGHPGMPWPLFGRIDPFSLARWSVRRRLSFHRRHPRASPRRRLQLALR
jgi:hypothetical protein